MGLFEGHKDSGLARLFIELPDQDKYLVVWKWPDQQIIKHSLVNVDVDYVAVFTNLGTVIGTLQPGRWPLDEGASLALGWLVDRLTGDAYYDAELYYVTTHDIAAVKFGGAVDNLSDAPSGLVVSLRVFGELAYRVVDPVALLTRLIGTDGLEDFNGQINTWVTEQALAAIRVVLPDLVATHGVLAMGLLQDATGAGALVKANGVLAGYGLAVTNFAELNVNLPDADAQQLKQLASAKAYAQAAGSFEVGVRGEAALDVASGVAAGNVGAQPAVVAGMMIGLPVQAPGVPAAPAAPAAQATQAPAAATAAPGAAGAGGSEAVVHFCPSCGVATVSGARFCEACGHALGGVGG